MRRGSGWWRNCAAGKTASPPRATTRTTEAGAKGIPLIRHPKIGQRVRVWYATRPRRKRPGLRAWAELMPLHGKTGTVAIVSRGPGPRNVGVTIDGRCVVVPRGNLNALP